MARQPAGRMTLRYLVRGRVQGVGFRYFVLRHATALGLVGWTRNLPDGRVEVVAEGEAPALETLEGQLRVGPPHSQVDAVEKSEILDNITVHTAFEII
ncbi:MAG: acylphosphatase [Gemmatimonadota bacterium]